MGLNFGDLRTGMCKNNVHGLLMDIFAAIYVCEIFSGVNGKNKFLCTAWFVADLVGNQNCWFSQAKVQLIYSNILHTAYPETTNVVQNNQHR